MLLYEQSSGTWATTSGVIIVTGCIAGNNLAGNDANNPKSQCIHNHGPLPAGIYTASDLGHQYEVHSMGLQLTPDPANDMCGRGDFYVHLRKPKPDLLDPGSSDGCITTRDYADLLAVDSALGKEDRRFTVVAVFPQFTETAVQVTA